MVHLPLAALSALLATTFVAAADTNSNQPAINNPIPSPVHSASTSTSTSTSTNTHAHGGHSTNTDTTDPPAAGLARVFHRLDEVSVVGHHRIVTPTEERTGPATKTGPPFDESTVGAGTAKGFSGVGSLSAYGRGLKAAGVAAVTAVVVGMMGIF